MRTSGDIVAVKAFGDLVIALASLERLPAVQRDRFRLLLGEHLLPLFEAMGSAVAMTPLAHGERGVPSFYDARKNGLLRALASGLRLRRTIAKAGSGTLLFDRLSWREHFLTGPHYALALPEADNIYRAYAALFDAPYERAEKHAETARPADQPARAGIFPGSRLAPKNLPAPLIEEVRGALAARNIAPTLCLLDGERPDLERAFPEARIVPRDFAAMKRAISDCDLVISADSMPAHIAEFAAIPVFVFSPVDNRYWLPLSAFEDGHWALFEHGAGDAFAAFVEAFSKDAR